MARLTKHQWLEAEELYRQGHTQKQIAEKFKVRVEAVSLHMKKQAVKGGESIDVVKQELEAAFQRKNKEFAQKKANRTIDTKEKFHTLVNSLLGFYIKELKQAQAAGKDLASMGGTAKALKESIMGLRFAREELYTILDIQPDLTQEETPDLLVMTMNEEDESRIRGSGAYVTDDEEDEEDPVDRAIEESNVEMNLRQLKEQNGVK